LPDTETSFVPGDFSVPYSRYQAAPFSTTSGTFESVSTLLISVGPW
jgi:hypothetical protein